MLPAGRSSGGKGAQVPGGSPRSGATPAASETSGSVVGKDEATKRSRNARKRETAKKKKLAPKD
eukprot:9431048-Lingulodinium_polyedra.AAC.1